MHPFAHYFVLASLWLGLIAGTATAALPAQAELEVQVGEETYILPAVGQVADQDQIPPPVDPATLATLETWRRFAWDPGKAKYLYHFAVTATTSAVTVLTPDSAAGEYARSLDRTAQRLADYVGPANLRKTYVAIVCSSKQEYERAVDFAGDLALGLTQEPIMTAYLSSTWKSASKLSPTFYQDLAGVVGCVTGNSEKWAPEHEIVRGLAVIGILSQAPHLWHVLPFLVGLSWNAEYDVTGDILSMPYGDEFQFDIGRGTWSSSKLSKVLSTISKAVKKEDKRELALRDLPYLGRGEGSTADAAAIAWAASRHLIRHHRERLPAFLAALSTEVLAANLVTHPDGSTTYNLDPGYQLPWESVEKVLAATVAEFSVESLAKCISASCPTCSAWAKERGIR
jgi:hypothetical protein